MCAGLHEIAANFSPPCDHLVVRLLVAARAIPPSS
jgi:hypothetical protein